MRTFKLTLEYDGSRYSGWQTQLNARTVQGELQRAADELFGVETDHTRAMSPPKGISGAPRLTRGGCVYWHNRKVCGSFLTLI